MAQNRQETAAAVFQAFRNSGFSPSQAQALTAEINRENSLRPQFLFGTHTDPANRATNVGMLSWQGSRADEVTQFLKKRGVMDDAGNITPGFDALQAQTDFIRQEMETNPAYARTKETFLAQDEVDPTTAAEVLGDNYIRWRRTDPEYSGSGYERIAEGYELLGANKDMTPAAARVQYGLGDRGVGAPAEVLRAVERGDMTKSEAGRFVSEELLEGIEGGSAYDILKGEEDEASFLDKLGGAAGALKTAGLMAAPEQPDFDSLSMRINPGRQNTGASALQRMGIASLA